MFDSYEKNECEVVTWVNENIFKEGACLNECGGKEESVLSESFDSNQRSIDVVDRQIGISWRMSK